jgi:hypothetical protein
MVHTLDDLGKNVFIQVSYGGINVMSQDHSTNNSVSITGRNVAGNQFAAGSKDFRGTINNITSAQSSKIDELTEQLIKALESEKSVQGTNTDDLIDAVKQVYQQTREEKINKISLQGVLSGISMVLQSTKDISTNTITLYNQWFGYIQDLFK